MTRITVFGVSGLWRAVPDLRHDQEELLAHRRDVRLVLATLGHDVRAALDVGGVLQQLLVGEVRDPVWLRRRQPVKVYLMTASTFSTMKSGIGFRNDIVRGVVDLVLAEGAVLDRGST
ncbi:hypothetical protein [Streptomyces resistomycificus]|uniref:hypothetical protein n=1 Tax=Streptomyces resistomycificus TaxID=67356 RepID=UPI000A3DC02D|nr:hypothetical protein [Streptomyces resistomycificus]